MVTAHHPSHRGHLVASGRIKLTAILVASWLQVIGAANTNSNAAPVVNGLMVTTTDLPLKYDATGPVNTSNAWSNNPPADVDGPWYGVPALAPPAAGGANWSFSVRHTAQFKSNQAVNAQLHVAGTHIQVPIPKHFEGPNALAEIATEGINIPVNRSANVSTWGGQEHLGQSPPHSDYYGVVGTKMKYTVVGATGTLGGRVDVIGRHSESTPKEFQNWRIDSTLASASSMFNPLGSTVSFDALTNMLTFQPGRIDLLDQQGGMSHGVDPQFASDQLLGAFLNVSPLTLEGVESDGRFRFSGGMVNVSGLSNDISLHAAFDEYLVGDTSLQAQVDSFGLLNHGATRELPNSETPTFLEAFAHDNVLQQSPTGGNFSDHAMALSILTAPGLNLAQLTNGFTQSAWNVPADIMIGGIGYNAPPDHLAGDYNQDGYVNGFDYQVWRGEFGNPAGLADGNGNGITDAADYVVWRNNAGIEPVTTIGRLSAAGIAVPEPPVFTPVLLGLNVLVAQRKLRPAASNQSHSRPN